MDPGYDPAQAWPGTGRFDDGIEPTLYLANSPEGAVAEYLRRHPELFGLALLVELWEIAVDVIKPALDLRGPIAQSTVGVRLDRLTSSDKNELERYRECRALMRDVISASLTGVLYPSAALRTGERWNLVLRGSDGWTSAATGQISPPSVAEGDVVVL